MKLRYLGLGPMMGILTVVLEWPSYSSLEAARIE